MNDETEQQIEDGYRRLGTALAPPPDIAVRVERRIRGRRTRRRAGVAGLAGLVLAGTVGGAVLLGGGDGNDGTAVASDQPSGPSGSFVLTRPDGSTYEFDDLTLSCDEAPGGRPATAGYIYLSSPFELDGSGEALTEPFVYLEAAVDKVDGQTYTLPVDSAGGSSDDRPLTLFVAEAGSPGQKRANEVSSAEPGAAGTVRVLRASCDPTPVLELEADTTLGSELEQGTLDLAGSFG